MSSETKNKKLIEYQEKENLARGQFESSAAHFAKYPTAEFFVSMSRAAADYQQRHEVTKEWQTII